MKKGGNDQGMIIRVIQICLGHPAIGIPNQLNHCLGNLSGILVPVYLSVGPYGDILERLILAWTVQAVITPLLNVSHQRPMELFNTFLRNFPLVVISEYDVEHELVVDDIQYLPCGSVFGRHHFFEQFYRLPIGDCIALYFIGSVGKFNLNFFQKILIPSLWRP
jgi:hypothetical protein